MREPSENRIQPSTWHRSGTCRIHGRSVEVGKHHGIRKIPGRLKNPEVIIPLLRALDFKHAVKIGFAPDLEIDSTPHEINLG